jgi:DNA-binding NarL/FixJ family response regulator
MGDKIKIVIVDDHNLVRQSLALALSYDPSFIIAGQAANGVEALRIIQEEVPDLILLDLEMPEMNGWQVLQRLKQEKLTCKPIIVSMYFDTLVIKDLVAKGARGFLPKNSDFETLLNAIHEVHEFGYYFSKKVSQHLVKELLSEDAITPVFDDIQLIDREKDILIQLCQDKLTKEIAHELKVSERTVERYKTSLYEKTKAKTSAGLVLFALQNNYYKISSSADQPGQSR